MTDDPTDPRAEALSRALRSVLRPLVRAMIARGLTAPAVYRMLKEVFVEVADRDFRLDGQRPTDSRISVLTGVHRKDIRALRTAAADRAAAAGPGARRVTAMANVVGRWLADPALQDDSGRPRPLPRTAPGEAVSFDRLVAGVSTDIRARTVLDELVRQNLVRLDHAGEQVELLAEAVLGSGDADQKLHFFARNVGDHIDAATANLLADPGPFLERAVFYNRLRPTSVDAIEAEARATAGSVLTALNRTAYERQMADRDQADAGERFRFGVYFYRAPDDDPGDPPAGGDEA